MSLADFRKMFPFRPYKLCYLRGADDKVMSKVECISFPWQEADGKVKINIRLTPNEPTTLATTECSNLLQIPQLVLCPKGGIKPHKFTPNIKCYPVVGSKGSKTLSLDCPFCGRRYFLITEIWKQNTFSEEREKIYEWWSDRKLEVLK